ncbi:MAG: DUF2007 domain-containing protein [Massilibacteroides sp.]|nr:DUF2007 domain-containing protein [Massilibacteroides sp.]MDD3063452.1 DUF2007 domain-containing protein [Massilibacteroides sp.]MDD4114458.1 DUF2007 domain-containing protein [Massilibacteroides sp.]MDD4660967.1 DUF2007 domain-containing protein [Massilibacteroides sp.]
MDKMVEIARFQYPMEAQPLMALLKSEGIDCYLRNEYSSQIMAGYVDIGGARIEVLENEAQRALEIMKDGGYEIPDENEEGKEIRAVSGLGNKIPWLKKLPLEKQIIIILGIVAIMLGLLLFASSLFE